MPKEALAIAANPLKSSGHLTQAGLDLFAGLVFANGIEKRRDGFDAVLDELDDEVTNVLKTSPLLEGLDIENPEDADAIFNKLKANESHPEWWLFASALLRSIAREEIGKGDAKAAAWAIAGAERFRSLYIFKQHFAEVVWMGHSAKRFTDLILLWDANKKNADEEFWQIQFQSNAFALAQLFSVPVTLIEGKAYVGGQGIDRQDARFVDFLFSGGSASEAILIEIKTPVTPILRRTKYRNVFSPSPELAGSVVQVADYRDTFRTDVLRLTKGKMDISTFNPKCIVIVGSSDQLASERERRSFELFRSQLANIEIITFDEVFQKIEQLATLFNIVRKTSDESKSA